MWSVTYTRTIQKFEDGNNYVFEIWFLKNKYLFDKYYLLFNNIFINPVMTRLKFSASLLQSSVPHDPQKLF